MSVRNSVSFSEMILYWVRISNDFEGEFRCPDIVSDLSADFILVESNRYACVRDIYT